VKRAQVLSVSEGSALVEFAIALPLLVVLVVGIFDFGAAFNTKQELNNAMREAARFGAAQPTTDLSNAGVPASVDAIRVLVVSYLRVSRINDCSLASAAGTNTATMVWTYITTSSGGCAGTLTLTIVRGFSTAGGGSTSGCGLVANNYGTPNPINGLNIPCTKVTISYPYQWHFNSAIQLIVPSANYGGLLQIQTDATVPNMN
jgi:Flp pilus assembly protein TadG